MKSLIKINDDKWSIKLIVWGFVEKIEFFHIHRTPAPWAVFQLLKCPSELGKYYAWISKLWQKKVYELRNAPVNPRWTFIFPMFTFDLNSYCTDSHVALMQIKHIKEKGWLFSLALCCQRLDASWFYLNSQKSLRKFSFHETRCPKPSI